MSVETRGKEANVIGLTRKSLQYKSLAILYSRVARTRVRLTKSSYGLFVGLHLRTTRMSRSEIKWGRDLEILEMPWGKQIVCPKYFY